MIGHLGVIQQFRKLEIQGEDAYWKIFQDFPYLRKACWEIWLEKEGVSLFYLQKLLERMEEALNEEVVHRSTSLFDMHMKLQTMIELHNDEVQEIEAKRLAKESAKAKARAEREAREKAELQSRAAKSQRVTSGNDLPEVKEHIIDLGESNSEKAERLFKELEESSFKEGFFDEIKEKALFVMRHHPDDDCKNSLIILLKNNGMNDIAFLFQS